MQALRDWFTSLAPRERWLVTAAGALLLVASVVIGIVRPLQGRAERSDALVAEREALLAELDALAARLGPQRGGSTAPANQQSLVLLVDRSLRSRGLAEFLVRNQPDGDRQIRLRLERAPFDAVVEWLLELQTRYGLSVLSANIDRTPEPGRVICNLVLTRGGA